MLYGAHEKRVLGDALVRAPYLTVLGLSAVRDD